MSERVNIPNLERITFFSGQRLTAANFSELQQAHRELRWLHNRSLHGWGIGTGLAVRGVRGGSMVKIGPGYAVDCLGREIILTETKTKTVPAVAGEAVFYLIAAYQADADQAMAERRPGVCLPEGTVRLGEEPRLEWRSSDKLDALIEGREIALARIWVRNCRLSRSPSLAPRRYARPSRQPYIAAGQTQAGNTPWLLSDGNDDWQGMSADVDTASARFRATPHYFAHVIGGRLHNSQIVVGIPSTLAPTPQGFTMQMFVSSELQGVQLLDVIKKELNWHIVWLGIEG